MFFHRLFNLFNRGGGRSKYTYHQKASSLAQGSVIVIENKPCEVITVERTRDTLKFVARDIFYGKEYNHQVKADAECECTYVYDTEYQITNISADGLLSLVTKDDEVRAPLSLPPVLPPAHNPPNDPNCDDDCHLDFLPRYIKRFNEGSLLFAAVKLAMGTEHVCCIVERKY